MRLPTRAVKKYCAKKRRPMPNDWTLLAYPYRPLLLMESRGANGAAGPAKISEKAARKSFILWREAFAWAPFADCTRQGVKFLLIYDRRTGAAAAQDRRAR
jgi:hypothetical protein